MLPQKDKISIVWVWLEFESFHSGDLTSRMGGALWYLSELEKFNYCFRMTTLFFLDLDESTKGL